MSNMFSDEIPFWIECPSDAIPEGALKGGLFNDEPLYIGRARHNGTFTPGSILPSRQTLFLPWGFATHQKTEFEILIGGSTVNWVACKGADVPENAFVGGYSEDSKALFVARVKYGDNLLVGKVHPQYKLSYMPDIENGKELECVEYEVLVV